MIFFNATQLEKVSCILVSAVKCSDENVTTKWSKWRVVEKAKK